MALGCKATQAGEVLPEPPSTAKAVERVYERVEAACDDLDSGLFDLALDQHCYCCMQFFGGAGASQSCEVDGHVWCRACSYQVHGWRGNGGQHREFADTARHP
jgi:hypothetical protein